MTARSAHRYPFSAIVGQETLRSALLINAVDPRVGGVLVRGEKGTAKSTAVRALAELLPPIDVVAGCRFGCDPDDPETWCETCRDLAQTPSRAVAAAPFVDVPLSATEDRLVGSLDLERVLATGVREFQPGLFAAAHRGVLYVDEVNLLDDHLVDTLLDVAAMGINTVERDGVSLSHPSRFVLVGTMNPEEGELRPQLLDRFGLCVDVEGVREVDARVEIIRRRERFESDPTGFVASFDDAEDELRATIATARRSLASVELPETALQLIARLTIAAGVDGHRADQVIARAARVVAALDGTDLVTAAHIRRVAPLALAHRMRRSPLDDAEACLEAARAVVSSVLSTDDSAEDEPREEQGGAPAPGREATAGVEVVPQIAQASNSARLASAAADSIRRERAGRTAVTQTDGSRGRYVTAQDAPPARFAEVAIDATVRAAAARQGGALADDLAIKIEPSDLRKAVRTRKTGATVVFAVDASGSMGALNRMEAAKGAVLSLLTEAYQRRDRVGLVSFRGDRAQTLLAPTASVELAQLRLRHVATGGSTPLAAGILASLDLLAAELRRDPTTVPWLVLVTDGRANVGLDGGLGSEDARAAAARVRTSGVRALLLDTAAGGSGAAREIAELAGAEYRQFGAPDAGKMSSLVERRVRPSEA